MRGTNIIVSAPTSPRGVFLEGKIAAAETPKPGTHLQFDASVALVGGRQTYKIYDRAADGDRPFGPLLILLPDYLQGRLHSTAYAAGERCQVYVPNAGEEFNLLLTTVAGTADDHTKNTLMIIDDGVGTLIDTTGSPQSTPYLLLEDITDPVGDVWAWCIYSGY